MRRFGFFAGLCLTVLSLAPAPTLAAQEIKPFVRGSYQQNEQTNYTLRKKECQSLLLFDEFFNDDDRVMAAESQGI